ncbi:MAG: NAD(P)H-hydrate dehydratase [Coprococcus sp.]
MRYLASAAEMQEIDRRTINDIGIPAMVLMERAACGVTERIVEHAGNSGSSLIVVEGGNNGGDGLAVARMLHEKGYDVDIYFIDAINRCSDSFLLQMDIIKKLGLNVYDHIPKQTYDVIVDGIFGVGLSRDVSGLHKEVIEILNQMTGLKAAIDVPSGIDSTTGAILGTAFRADITVTFGLMKSGLIFYPGHEYCGTIYTADIGFPQKVIEDVKPKYFTFDKKDASLRIPKRRNDSNKGTYGKVAVIAGNKDISGALTLAAKAAYKTGCGLVKVYTHESNRNIIGITVPEAVVMTYNDSASAMLCVEDAMSYGDTLLIGPGIGTEGIAVLMLIKILTEYKKLLIIDADGINILAEHMELLEDKKASIILTPHMKEMERMNHVSINDMKKNMPLYCEELAEKYNVTCVLKDARTCVSDGSGHVYVNTSGNNGMSTGGSGDVLAGIIAALCCMGKNAVDMARLGVYIHGLAGDYARMKKGSYGMTSGDIAESIPYVLGGDTDGQNI